MMRKSEIGAAVLLFIILVGFYITYNLETSASIEACINEWKSKNLTSGLDFAPGDITVSFRSGVTKDDALNVMNSYGLKPNTGLQKVLDSYQADITVPMGLEFEWLCTLQKNPKVKYAELNHRL